MMSLSQHLVEKVLIHDKGKLTNIATSEATNQHAPPMDSPNVQLTHGAVPSERDPEIS